MCGIFGFIGPAPDKALIAELARKAGRRGPHACGWAVRTASGLFEIERRAGSLASYAERIPMGSAIIGHSRLATTGGGSYKNLDDAQPLTLPGAQPFAQYAFVHNGVAGIECGEPLDTGNDSEALLRLALRSGLAAAVGALPTREPYAVIFAGTFGLHAARRGLPLYCRADKSGAYLCSVIFAGAAALPEGEVRTFQRGDAMASKHKARLDQPAAKITHPISTVTWIDPKTLRANDYNPNHVAPPELELLKLSILEDGWTQPIVARPDGEVVDGFHRYTLGLKDADIRAASGGLVPVVFLRPNDAAHQMMSTIRHNRARGTHGVLKMAEIVRTLARDLKVPEADIMKRLGMEDEEVERLLDTGGMIKRGAGTVFANGWQPE